MLKPIRKLQLGDRPYHASVSKDGRILAVCTPSGKCRLFDNDLRQLDEMDFSVGVAWIQLNRTGSLLLVGFQDHIRGFTTTGNICPSFNLALTEPSDSCCVFGSNEQILCVASWGRAPKLMAWDMDSTAVIDETALPKVGGAGFFLVPHPEGEAMAVIAYSGQSEEWMFWAHFANARLRVYDQPQIEDVAFPCFLPTGRELVSFHERLGLCRMRFPSGALMASIRPEQAFPNSPDYPFSYDMHFLRDDRVLVWQSDLALYELDLATLRPVATVLTGVEGMTFGKDHFYSAQSWQLADGRLLTSDCQHDLRFEKRMDTLRLWDASELCGPLSKPDPSRPYTQELLNLPRSMPE